MSQSLEPTPPPFSHDLTAKSIFAEPEAARDLVALLAARECPELWGWTPVRLVAGSAVTADPERHPPQAEGHRDLVWELARGDQDAERMLLHLEFQSRRGSDMSERMFRYALRMSPGLRGLEVCGVVVHTGVDRFGEWWSPVQTMAGVRRYGFREGALLEIHDHAVPGLEGGAHALPPDNLASGFVALARVQAEMARGRRAVAALVLPVLRELILPRALGTAPSLRRALGAWFKTRFDGFWRINPTCARRCVESSTLRRRRQSCTHSANTWKTRRRMPRPRAGRRVKRAARRRSSLRSSGKCGAMRKRTGVPGSWTRPHSTTCPTSRACWRTRRPDAARV